MSAPGQVYGDQDRSLSLWTRRAELLVLLAIVSAMVTSIALLWWYGQPNRNLFKAVPESVFPQIDGVDVLSSVGTDGQSCCEQHSGSRDILVRAPAVHGAGAVGVATDGMLASGWEATICANGGPPQCVQTDGFFAIVQLRHPAKRDSVEVSGSIERTP